MSQRDPHTNGLSFPRKGASKKNGHRNQAMAEFVVIEQGARSHSAVHVVDILNVGEVRVARPHRTIDIGMHVDDQRFARGRRIEANARSAARVVARVGAVVADEELDELRVSNDCAVVVEHNRWVDCRRWDIDPALEVARRDDRVAARERGASVVFPTEVAAVEAVVDDVARRWARCRMRERDIVDVVIATVQIEIEIEFRRRSKADLEWGPR